jgi:hypothetical protein
MIFTWVQQPAGKTPQYPPNPMPSRVFSPQNHFCWPKLRIKSALLRVLHCRVIGDLAAENSRQTEHVNAGIIDGISYSIMA